MADFIKFFIIKLIFLFISYELACELFPIPRSIAGQGFRDSLEILNKTLGGGGGYSNFTL